MMRMFSFFLLLLIYLGSPSLYARVLQPKMISIDKYFIQVAALSKEYNVKKTLKKLSKYDLYIEKHKDLKRIFVVNVNSKSELIKIKKFYPSAFFARVPDFDAIDIKNSKKIGQFEILQDITPTNSTNIIDEVNEPSKSDTMNSDTILKTRKTFL